MDYIDFPLDVKDVGEDGAIEGLAAAYNNIDFGGDIILPGAFTKTLKGRKSLPMLMYHDQRIPVGVWSEFSDSQRGVSMKGRIVTSTAAGIEALALAREGALSGLSIGYRSVKERFTDKARELIEVVLHEVSLVAIPMNEKTQITRVKEIQDLRARLAAGDRLTEREWEGLLKKGFDLSNSEAERAVRINLKGQGEPDVTADPMAALWAAMRDAPIEDLTGE
ncbi:HK97 family phage prohead protease [Sphingomonas sp. VDB2]|uniref:HK97 family phage prohead protease n=1 Tax=Sphingomonas sp. VDB2 TaxID=3228751 RepID=UPI003A8117B0